ncbi:MAG TPA: hypothetical protein V6C97_18340 [Oculatellaceae cyanobacterium]
MAELFCISSVSIFHSKIVVLPTEGICMLSEIVVDQVTYTAKDEPLKLLMVLRRCLDETLESPQRVTLSDAELLALKSWLLMHAESMRSGKAVWVEESIDGKIYKLVAAIGKTPAGEPIVWHPPLPWPFDFTNESKKIDL